MEESWMAKLPAIVGESQYVEKNGRIVVFPNSTEHVSSIVKLANENQVKLAVKKSKESVVKQEPKILLDLSKMDTIVEIDRENVTAAVMTGINLAAFQSEMKKRGFYFPPTSIWDNGSLMIEAIAANHTGPSSGKYGKWREYVLGMEVVLPTGEILNLGGKNIKCVSGLDMMGLFIGSHSQLGIVTKVLLRLLPKPEASKLSIARVNTLLDGVNAANTLGPRGQLPARNELITPNMAWEMQIPGIEKGQTVLLTEIEGFVESLSRQLAEVDLIYQKYGVKSQLVISDEKEIEEIWSRYFFTASLHMQKQTYNLTIIPSKLPSLYDAIEKICRQTGFSFEMIMHCGVVNIDLFLDSIDSSNLIEFEEGLFKALLLLGGKMADKKIGIGSHVLEIEKLESGLKRLFDPSGVMAG
ncbi:MAG: FAD-binding oxidoreductase [Bacillota bacterium]